MDQTEGTLDRGHFLQSSLREKLLEHVFIGKLLQSLWRLKCRDIEVLRGEIDSSGYDLVLECNGVLRHVQFKSSHKGASAREVTVHVTLESKPSGCVIWIFFNKDTLELDHFLWFGGHPGQPLPPLGDRRARQARGNSKGIKAEKPKHRVVRKNRFTNLSTMDDVVLNLFGLHSELRPEIASKASAEDNLNVP